MATPIKARRVIRRRPLLFFGVSFHVFFLVAADVSRLILDKFEPD